ncbi:hypothetical protein Q8A67_016133 [Cirrhinus molitorella]|uniref:Uncharacterized protein n=1 Tax=Cirrhinus molitorella TaxID=172907 RepID=A0AA88PJ38_9TELE|nr:hypothetical protein Q8A67_016133 [Cirrhinus molitorella]
MNAHTDSQGIGVGCLNGKRSDCFGHNKILEKAKKFSLPAKVCPIKPKPWESPSVFNRPKMRNIIQNAK